MWICWLTYSSQLLVALIVLVFEVHTCQFHTKIRNLERPFKGYFYNEKTRRLVECVYKCVQHTNCISFGYNKTSSVCHLYPPITRTTQYRSGTLLFGDLREAYKKRQKLPEDQIVLMRGRTSWHDAQKTCNKVKCEILDIPNDFTQARAVNVANDSGLETVAIGVYKQDFKWVNIYFKDLVYQNWADGQPKFLGFFAVLSRKKGYKWVSIGNWGRVDGVLCGKG